MRVGFLIAGFKGFNFFKAVHTDCNISFISSYNVKGTFDNSYESIRILSLKKGYRFIERNDLSKDIYDDVDIVFIAGWQYLLHGIDERFVILHDSLLPKFRGFSPTVTALILGEKEIGVSALKPTKLADHGPVYEQKAIKIEYPIRIGDAYLLLADCYAQVARSMLARFGKGDLKAVEQDDSLATYSIWRDEHDYFIDWSWPANKIVRFVDAVSWPYLGAKTIYRSEQIVINEVSISKDMNFAERHQGKIWLLNDGMPEIVCGEGMIRIISAMDAGGRKVVFSKVRGRLGFP